MLYKIVFNPTNKVVNVLLPEEAIPAGSTDLGNFDHAVAIDPLGKGDSHVVFHHVQAALYKLGVQDMQSVTILMSETVIVIATAIAPTANAMFVTVGQTGLMDIGFTPVDPSDLRITFVSSDPTKATVSGGATVVVAGREYKRILVTGVAAGNTTVTVTHTATGLTTSFLVTAVV
jgi:uncharacterized protein YjdB